MELAQDCQRMSNTFKFAWLLLWCLTLARVLQSYEPFWKPDIHKTSWSPLLLMSTIMALMTLTNPQASAVHSFSPTRLKPFCVWSRKEEPTPFLLHITLCYLGTTMLLCFLGATAPLPLSYSLVCCEVLSQEPRPSHIPRLQLYPIIVISMYPK
jgi:hypothetical protein